MKLFYEHLQQATFCQLTLDKIDFSLTVLSGVINDFHFNLSQCKKSEKTYKKLETAERNFEKRRADLESKGYELSDPEYPLAIQLEVEECKKSKADVLDIDVHHEKYFEAVFELTHLTHLGIYTKEGVSIPKELGKLKNIEVLSIKGDNKKLPDVFDQFPKLREFYFYNDGYSGNTMAHLPPSFYKCKNLEILNIAMSSVQFLSDDMSNFEKLRNLIINNTQIEELPAGIGKCKELKFIDATNCPKLKTLPVSFGELSKLNRLELPHCGFRDFPEVLTQLSNLRSLNLKENKLTKLSEDIGNMSGLKTLIVTHPFSPQNASKIEELPNSIGKLTELEQLVLSNQSISKLPASFSQLKSLESLNLNFNKIKQFEESFFDLEKLEDLYLENNEITKLQKSFRKLSNLSSLELSGNQIPNIPQNVLGWGDPDDIFEHLDPLQPQPAVKVDDLLTAEEKGKILEAYGANIKKFLRFADNEYGTEQTDMYDIHKFLTFETNVLPILKTKKWFDKEGLQSVWVLFAPFKEWTEVDRRLMAVLTKNKWGAPSRFAKGHDSERGLNQSFFKWYQVQIEEGKEPDYDEIVQLLKEHGKGDNVFEETLGNLVNHLFIGGAPTKFGEVVIQHFKEDSKTLLKMITPSDENKIMELKEKIIDFLLRFAFEDFEPQATDWLFAPLKESDGGFRYRLSSDNVRLMVQKDPQKYEPILLEAAEKIRSASRQPQLGIDLHRFYGMKHKDLILKFVSADLNGIFFYGKNWFEMKVDGENVSTREEYMTWILEHFKEEIKPFVFDLLKKKPTESEIFYKLLLDTYPKEIIPHFAALLEKKQNAGKILPLLYQHDYTNHHNVLWTLLASEEEEDRQLAAVELDRLYDDKDLIETVKKILNAKPKEIRDGAVQVLILLESEQVKTVLQEQLAIEKVKSIREMIVKSLKERGGTSFLTKELFEEFEDPKTQRKLTKPVKKWLDITKLPPLYWENGKQVEVLFPNFLFQKQKAKEKDWYKLSEEVALLLADIDKAKSGDFAHELLQLILKNGEIKAVNKILLPVVSYLGDNRVVEAMMDYCIKKKNVLSANLLGNNVSKEAARALEAIALHFHTKYPNVRESAFDSFGKIAQKMGLTRMELLDEMIPNFGFVDLFKPIDIEGDNYRAFITSDLKLAYLDELDKIKKTLPSKASKELKDEIKVLNKEIRTIAKQQTKSLEHNFICERKWLVPQWQSHFMGKPLMFAFAQSLIWGIYENGELKNIFSVNDDQTLEDADFEEITLSEKVKIGIVHPIQLDEALLEIWKQRIVDSKLKQPFEQMRRPIYLPKNNMLNKTILFDFEMKEARAGSFKSVLEKRGWRRGSVQDSGGVYAYRKAYEVSGIEVFIALEGMSVQIWDYSSPVALKELYFTKIDSIEVGNYVYDTYRGEDDPRLIKIKDVPTVVYSETVNDLNLLIKR